MTILDRTQDQLVTLLTEEQIQQRIKELAEKINNEFADSQELTVVGVLCGSILFLSDLVKHLKMPVQLEFIRLSSYGNEQSSSGKIKPVDLTLPSLEGKDVLLVEDIVDTGLTATFLFDYIKIQHKARKIKFVTLLNKLCSRVKPVQVDFIGFEIDDKFVVGYGLDYKGFYRNLPYVGYFPL
ncbi:MAG: hypoxanthine phosphoribosyltransferase [Candidatus Melainabacteria bacterium GWF2_32_7]|nr:MAG: hypoxanthine phosphoribosyltransferase [Candidatus Melainabacteria bacterium GWF2_32_7]